MDTEIITRKQYLAGSYLDPTLHQRYYAQFASPVVIDYVVRIIGADKIRSSTDPNMNDIPLRYWDALMPPVDWGLFAQATGSRSHSLSDVVCISKAAARVWKERNKNVVYDGKIIKDFTWVKDASIQFVMSPTGTPVQDGVHEYDAIIHAYVEFEDGETREYSDDHGKGIPAWVTDILEMIFSTPAA